MLHHTQDAACSSAVRFWTSRPGFDAFVTLVGTHVHPPPSPTDPEVQKALNAAVPVNLVSSAADVDQRVQDAARDVAWRLSASRKLTETFYDSCTRPPPPRHAVYAGESDRLGEDDARELTVPSLRNPNFGNWAQLL